MLETIREFGIEPLEASEEAASIRHRHLAWMADLAEAIEPSLVGADQNRWLERLDAEGGNVRAALAWARSGGDPLVGLRLASALGRSWEMRSQIGEGRAWLSQLLDLAPAEANPARAKACA